MKKIIKRLSAVVLLMIIVMAAAIPAFADTAEPQTTQGAVAVTTAAETDQVQDSTSSKAIAVAIVIGLAAAAGALGMGLAISKSAESVSRQPEASGKIRSMLMLGLVFIETVVIYALIVAILIIFVL